MSDIDELIRKRLENLRGDSAPKASTSSALPKVVKKTAPEQVEDLLAQLSEESDLYLKDTERNLDIDSQIRTRLEKLKSREGCEFIPSKSNDKKPTPAAKDDDLADPEFFRKASTCDELLADLGIQADKDSFSDDSDESDTLCNICDEKKPTLICVDCDKDYYCQKCFKEYHSDDDDHKTVPYNKK